LFALPVFVSGPLGILSLLAPSQIYRLKFNNRLLSISIFGITIFALTFILLLNESVARATLLLLVNLILFALIFSEAWIRSSEYVADRVYYLNLAILLAANFFKPVAELFARSGVAIDRVGGLIGYDFVAFFIAVYLICKIESGRLVPGLLLLIHAAVAAFVILNSGRFGFIILTIFLLYFLNKFYSFRIILIILAAALGVYIFNAERVNLIFSTLYGLFDFLIFDNDVVLNSIDVGEGSGFYSLSPLAWINEFNLIFDESTKILFPSSTHLLVDSGPAYMLLNAGLLLTFIFYFIFYLFLRSAGVSSLFLMLIIFVCDLKLRMAFSLFPMFWIYINLAYLKHGVNVFHSR
jgi:hypothetical protein